MYTWNCWDYSNNHFTVEAKSVDDAKRICNAQGFDAVAFQVKEFIG